VTICIVMFANGVKLCPSGTGLLMGPIVHPPDDTRVNMEHLWNDSDRENRRTGDKPVPVPLCSPHMNQSLHGEKSATNCGNMYTNESNAHCLKLN
jgi:hypothetical protein